MFIFLKLFVLLEFPVMLMTLILVIKYGQQNFSNKEIDIINFGRRFLNFIGDILTSCLNVRLKTLLLQGFSSWCINSEK